MNKGADAIRMVAENVRQRRNKLSWSQEELAERCGLHRTYIGAIERGERNITVVTLFRVADALSCDVVALLKVGSDD